MMVEVGGSYRAGVRDIIFGGQCQCQLDMSEGEGGKSLGMRVMGRDKSDGGRCGLVFSAFSFVNCGRSISCLVALQSRCN